MEAPNPVNNPRNGPRAAVGVLIRPGETFARLVADPRPGLAVGSGLVLGMIWAGFMGWLAADGHRPTMDRGLPVSAERYYAIAAIYMIPLCIGLTLLTAGVAHRVARLLGGAGGWPATLATVGPAYALPLLALYLVPDVAVYAVAGHAGLAYVLRFGLPLAVLLVALRTVGALRAAHGLSRGRAWAAALTAGVAQAIPFALLVR